MPRQQQKSALPKVTSPAVADEIHEDTSPRSTRLPPTEDDLFLHHKHEAFGLQLKENTGEITPDQRARLGVLQAKMDEFWERKREHAERFQGGLANTSVFPPEKPRPEWKPMSGSILGPIQRQENTASPRSEAEPTRVRQTPRSSAPIQANGWAGLGGLLGGGIIGGGLAGLGYAYGLTNPIALAAMVGVPALLGGAYGLSRSSGPRVLPRQERAKPDVSSEKLTGDGGQIPPLMHFIWLGGKVPSDRIRSIGQWAEAARGSKINLWLDRNSAKVSRGDLEGLVRAGVRIRHVEELAESSERFGRAMRDLPTVDSGGVNGGAAGALSDLARLEILNNEGGTYMDSDNTPGERADLFSNLHAPEGLRLGWDKLEHSENFSNDAMSAVRGHPFIRDYMEHAYGNLDERTIGDIRSREKERVKMSVMGATGPEAMARIPLPTSRGHREAIGAESRSSDFLTTDPDRVTIRDFPGNREMNAEMLGGTRPFSPAMDDYFQDIAYTGQLFNRGSDNSWLPPARGRSSTHEDRKKEE